MFGNWHWNGVNWTSFGGPSGVIWSADPTHIWVATQSLVYEWSGTSTTWTQVYAGGHLVYYMGLWGSSPTDLWLATEDGAISSLGAVHWDGVSWTPQPLASGGTLSATAVSGSASNDVWFVGPGGVTAHWDGSGLSLVPSGTPANLSDVTVAGPDDAWAVGASGTVLHWDGARWARRIAPTNDMLNGVWEASTGDVYLAGDGIMHRSP
jgi:hypothetical protein